MSNYRISYAQNNEDIIISGFFEGIDNGFYVDVGANHPDKLSITKIFYDRGWSGLNLEPNRELFKLITKSRPRDINLNIGAADKTGELTLREYPEGDGLSTFSKSAQNEYEKDTSVYHKYTRKYIDVVVPVLPLRDIFKQQNIKHISFMTIDVEGFEYQVIKGNDWTKYRPLVLCIEANHIVEDWRPLIKAANYELVFFDGLNNYYVAQEHPEVIDRFSYVNTVILGKPIISPHIQEVIKKNERYVSITSTESNISSLESNISSLESKLIRQSIVAQGLRAEIDRLNGYISSHNRLRSLVKHIILAVHGIIILNIEKLNKSKRRNLPLISQKVGASISEQMVELKIYDMRAYFGIRQNRKILYRIIISTYRNLIKFLYKLAKVVFIQGKKVMRNG